MTWSDAADMIKFTSHLALKIDFDTFYNNFSFF